MKTTEEGLNLLLWYERAILEHKQRHKPTFSSLFNAENLLLWYERAILEHKPRHKPTFSSLFDAERSARATGIFSSRSCITTAF